MKAVLIAALVLLSIVAIVPATDARPIPPPNCYEVYTRTDVGDYAIVRRNSCAPPEVYQCPYPRAPISECEGLIRS